MRTLLAISILLFFGCNSNPTTANQNADEWNLGIYHGHNLMTFTGIQYGETTLKLKKTVSFEIIPGLHADSIIGIYSLDTSSTQYTISGVGMQDSSSHFAKFLSLYSVDGKIN